MTKHAISATRRAINDTGPDKRRDWEDIRRIMRRLDAVDEPSSETLEGLKEALSEHIRVAKKMEGRR